MGKGNDELLLPKNILIAGTTVAVLIIFGLVLYFGIMQNRFETFTSLDTLGTSMLLPATQWKDASVSVSNVTNEVTLSVFDMKPEPNVGMAAKSLESLPAQELDGEKNFREHRFWWLNEGSQITVSVNYSPDLVNIYAFESKEKYEKFQLGSWTLFGGSPWSFLRNQVQNDVLIVDVPAGKDNEWHVVVENLSGEVVVGSIIFEVDSVPLDLSGASDNCTSPCTLRMKGEYMTAYVSEDPINPLFPLVTIHPRLSLFGVFWSIPSLIVGGLVAVVIHKTSGSGAGNHNRQISKKQRPSSPTR